MVHSFHATNYSRCNAVTKNSSRRCYQSNAHSHIPHAHAPVGFYLIARHASNDTTFWRQEWRHFLAPCQILNSSNKSIEHIDGCFKNMYSGRHLIQQGNVVHYLALVVSQGIATI